MGTRENTEPYTIDILLNSRAHDIFGGLVQSGVNHLHTGITESARDDFSAAVVAI
jgi:hypothetical protein